MLTRAQETNHWWRRARRAQGLESRPDAVPDWQEAVRERWRLEAEQQHIENLLFWCNRKLRDREIVRNREWLVNNTLGPFYVRINGSGEIIADVDLYEIARWLKATRGA